MIEESEIARPTNVRILCLCLTSSVTPVFFVLMGKINGASIIVSAVINVVCVAFGYQKLRNHVGLSTGSNMKRATRSIVRRRN